MQSDDFFYDPALNDDFYTPDSNELERPDWEDDEDYAREMAAQADADAAAERYYEETAAAQEIPPDDIWDYLPF